MKHAVKKIHFVGVGGSGMSGIAEILHNLGYEVSEGRISVDDWKQANADGTLTEVFACGTAAAITPVGSVKSTRADWTVADGQPALHGDDRADGLPPRERVEGRAHVGQGIEVGSEWLGADRA